jgi:hypothetical protein
MTPINSLHVIAQSISQAGSLFGRSGIPGAPKLANDDVDRMELAHVAVSNKSVPGT